MKCWILNIISFVPFIGFSQTLEATTNKDQILIGQELIIEYTVQSELNDSIFFEPSEETISIKTKAVNGSLTTSDGELEILEEFELEILEDKKGKTWIGKYVVTSWDSGAYLIPGQKVVINDSTFYFPDISIRSLLVPKNESIDLYDIRENYADVPDGLSSVIRFLKSYWWAILIGVIAIILIVLARRKKNKTTVVEVPKLVSLKERTITAIEALESAKLWEKNELKTHFVELSYILRSYLTARYNISLLEKTTYESALLLVQCGLEKETIDVIVKILSQADMVKFAKSKPDELSILRISAQAKQIVAETSPLEFENVE